MKVVTIVTAFPILTKVYDSLEDFNRIISLLDSYNELKSIVELFEKKKEVIIKELKEGSTKELTPEQFAEGNARLNEYAGQKVELKNSLIQFTKAEIEKSKIKGSEISQIISFIQL